MGCSAYFVDYAGDTATVHEAAGPRAVQVFVAVLDASSYTYVEASWSQCLEHWIESHVRALEFLGGAPRILVPANLKSGVTRVSRYSPEINRSYLRMARHYEMAVVPARPYRPRDKAKAEVGVQVAERWILAALRNRRCSSLGELNAAIRELLKELNERPLSKRAGSRASLFAELDQPALRALPAQRFEYEDWLMAKVQSDHHVAVRGHYYSVPSELVQERVDVRLTASSVEMFRAGRRVAVHQRSYVKGGATTCEKHRPRAHRELNIWSAEQMLEWAVEAGPQTGQLMRELLEKAEYPQENHRGAWGILRLAKMYGTHRLEAAAQRALYFQTCDFRSLDTILRNNMDRERLPERKARREPLSHANVRGASYYAATSGEEEEC